MSRAPIVVAGAALLAAGWFARELVGFDAGAAAEVAADSPAVRVTAVKRAAFNPVSEYIGHVEPVQSADILPQIDGYIRRVAFTEGARVEKGELLFEIDDEQYLAARNLRRSEIASAEAKVVVARAEVERAERYHGRLAAADDRGITATELDTAETTLASAKAAYNAALAAVEQAKASAAIADFNLKHTKVYSPIAGRIGKAMHHVGDYVSPSKSALARVVQTDPIRVVFPITDKDYGEWRAAAERGGAALEKSRRFHLALPDGREYARAGAIDFGDNEIGRDTATLVMYAAFANPDADLIPNQVVRVRSDLTTPPTLLTVPAGAVERTAAGDRVWTIDAAGVVKAREVKTGATWRGLTVIESGLSEGDRIVTDGNFKLKDGVRVTVVEG